MNGRWPAAVAGMTEVISTECRVLAQAQAVGMAQGITAGEVFVLGHRGCGVACACGAEAGRGFATAAVAVGKRAREVAAGVAIAAAVGEGTGAESGRVAAVAVGHTRASPRRDIRALVLPAGEMRRRKP